MFEMQRATMSESQDASRPFSRSLRPQIRMGMIDRGANVSLLSQFPAEAEILFAPLTGLEVVSPPRAENGVIVVELRLSCNLHDETME
jgi:hypothetical protein